MPGQSNRLLTGQGMFQGVWVTKNNAGKRQKDTTFTSVPPSKYKKLICRFHDEEFPA